MSPDGTRIAYQFSDFVTVFDRTTRATTRFTLASPYDVVLAGRSAWAPDGSLTLLHKRHQSEGYTWELQLVDPTDGALRRVIPVPGSPTLIRLIGWSQGDTVVVIDHGPYSALDSPSNVIVSGYDGTVSVAWLTGGQTRTLVHPANRINFIDVAEQLLADPRTRPGNPPWALPPFDRGTASLCLLITAAVLVTVWVLVHRRRSPAVPPTAP